MKKLRAFGLIIKENPIISLDSFFFLLVLLQCIMKMSIDRAEDTMRRRELVGGVLTRKCAVNQKRRDEGG